jgi:hypothetical protein
MTKVVTIAFTLVLLVPVTPLGAAQPDSVTSSPANKGIDAAWLEYVNLPTAAALRTKAVGKNAARTEIDDLTTVARTIFLPATGFTGKAIDENVIPVPSLYDESDVLVVRLDTPTGIVTVQDGLGLYVAVDPDDSKRVSIDDKSAVNRHVMQVALSVFDLPAAGSQEDRFTVFGGLDSHGTFAFGTIAYDFRSASDWSYKHWYSVMRWSSDGDRVLFQVDKFGILHPDINRAMMSKIPGWTVQPRKFGVERVKRQPARDWRAKTVRAVKEMMSDTK